MNDIIQRIKCFWKERSNQITLVISALAVVVFFARGLYYVSHQAINMDEGTYLLKGRYYLEGTYRPYEIGGPVTNKGVFSFWILGLSQLIAPGILSGRLFALISATGMLAVLWLIVRRFSNQTWAAVILLLLALNGFWISLYARALTQPVTSALIVFSVFFLTLKPAKIWHLTLGLLFGVVLSLTRQNLIPFYIFAIAYVIWQHGFKRAWVPIAASAGVFLIINAIYWPEIYRYMWRPLVRIVIEIADAILPGQWRVVNENTPQAFGDPVVAYGEHFIRQPWNIFHGLAVYIIPVSVVLAFLFCGNWKKAAKHEYFKTFVFLFSSYVVLFLIHVMAVLNDNELIFSFQVYPGFFLPLGLLVIPWCVEWMNIRDNLFRNILVSLVGVFMSTGIGLALHRIYSDRLMFLTVPRVRDMHLQPGTTELWRTLENKFHLGYNNIEYLLAAVYGFLVGICLVAICYVFFLLLRKKDARYTYAGVFLSITLGLVTLFSPTPFLAGYPSADVCKESPVKTMEEVSGILADTIPDDSLVYFEDDQSAIFLYLENVKVFPLQLNYYFYKQSGGDPDLLAANQLWNDEIARTWIRQADYILLSENSAKTWERRMNTEYNGLYDKIDETENLNECIDRSFLHVYRNLAPID